MHRIEQLDGPVVVIGNNVTGELIVSLDHAGAVGAADVARIVNLIARGNIEAKDIPAYGGVNSLAVSRNRNTVGIDIPDQKGGAVDWVDVEDAVGRGRFQVTGLASGVRHGAGGRTIGIELKNLPALIVVAGVKRAAVIGDRSPVGRADKRCRRQRRGGKMLAVDIVKNEVAAGRVVLQYNLA